MMAAIRFTEGDRDQRGFVALEPRSLADLLPKPAEIKQDAQRQTWTRAEWAALAAVALIAAFVLVWRWSAPSAPPMARPTPAATPAPTAQPTPLPIMMLPAFSAPDVPLGEIEETRVMTPTAHYGQDWIQAQVQGSGRIWLRAADWPALAMIGPDLAPRPTVTAAPYVPPPTPVPQPPCLTAGTGAQIVTVCDWLDPEALDAAAAAQWLAQYGGNIGTVTTPTPYPWSTP